MTKEHDRVVLTAPVSEEQLEIGDVWTVVHVYGDGRAFEVEFVMLDGSTAAVVTVQSSQVRPVRPREITHAREFRRTLKMCRGQCSARAPLDLLKSARSLEPLQAEQLRLPFVLVRLAPQTARSLMLRSSSLVVHIGGSPAIRSRRLDARIRADSVTCQR
ncbi:MAG: DUF4926 domain-containing protein [Luteitalea sp.]|nr:DUF4926 domain-containing protein [Luteitalea sp.]